MIRRRLGTLLATLALGFAGGTVATVVSTTPAQAGTETCGARYFLKSASTGRYLSIEPTNGRLYADRTVKGWWEQFRVCRNSLWDPNHFALKSEAMSTQNGADSYLQPEGGLYRASSHTLTFNDLFEWRGGNPYYGLLHPQSGRYLTVETWGSVHPGPDNLGWGQALNRES